MDHAWDLSHRLILPYTKKNGPWAWSIQHLMLAANAEIERLRALLAAKDTLALSSETLSYDRLADVLEMLSQRLARADSPAAPSKSAKIPDPPILTDRKDLTFNN